MTTPQLAAAWESARKAWSGVEVSRDDFEAFITAHGPESEETEGSENARPLHYADLYLACACARGDPTAIKAFEVAYLSEVDAAVAKVGGTAPPADEMRQVLRHKLFVGDGNKHPQIVRYSGRVALRTWVRVVATRAALNLAERAARERPLGASALTLLVGSGTDPEVEYFKRLYTAAFHAAVEETFDTLGSRDRNLLRYAFADGLTVEAIGSLYGVHRATAARWVVRAHGELVAGIKKALVRRLGIGHKDYASILRIIQSRCGITLNRYLRGGHPSADDAK